MSRKGENIYKRKDGRWEGRYVRCYDENERPSTAMCMPKHILKQRTS